MNTKEEMYVDRLEEENERLKNAMNGIFKEAERLQTENYNLKGELSYLKQKVKEYRHKTWFPVYEENLKLQQELEQYKTVLDSVESFIGQYSKEKKGDKGCH
jgi:regulator of replication initiation timing